MPTLLFRPNLNGLRPDPPADQRLERPILDQVDWDTQFIAELVLQLDETQEAQRSVAKIRQQVKITSRSLFAGHVRTENAQSAQPVAGRQLWENPRQSAEQIVDRPPPRCRLPARCCHVRHQCASLVALLHEYSQSIGNFQAEINRHLQAAE